MVCPNVSSKLFNYYKMYATHRLHIIFELGASSGVRTACGRLIRILSTRQTHLENFSSVADCPCHNVPKDVPRKPQTCAVDSRPAGFFVLSTIFVAAARLAQDNNYVGTGTHMLLFAGMDLK